jgi:archaetidylinositol phosphate synthase
MRPFVRTRLRPNHVTTLRLATGIAAALAFAVGTHESVVLGGWLFVISAFLDRADGELARLSGRSSPGGHRYDLASDVASNVLNFGAIGVGLSHGALGSTALGLGAVAAFAIGAIFWLVQQMESIGESFDGAAGFDPDDALFIVGPAAWFGALKPLLYAAVVCAPLFLVFAASLYLKRRTALRSNHSSR